VEVEEELKLKYSKAEHVGEEGKHKHERLSEKSNVLLNSLQLGKRKTKREKEKNNENELTLSMINNEKIDKLEKEGTTTNRQDLEAR